MVDNGLELASRWGELVIMSMISIDQWDQNMPTNERSVAGLSKSL
jgi:hypothetical protein